MTEFLLTAFVPAFTTTFPSTTTSWSTCAPKVLPTESVEEMELRVLTVIVVPAGIVAAFKDEAAKQTQTLAVTAMNLSRIMLV